MKIIFPILFIILSIVLFIFFVNPFYQDVTVLKDEITIYNTAITNSDNLQKTQDSLLDIYKNIKISDKERLNGFLPNSVNNIQFILEIERIANLHNMPLKDIKFEPIKKAVTTPTSNIVLSEVSKDNRTYGVFPIQFSTEGKYEQFVLFLKDLEHNLRLIDVKAISFSAQDIGVKAVPGVDPNINRYTLKVETYWLK